MTYDASAFEQVPLALGVPSAQMRDRWNTSLGGWETDVADVVAHLTSAIATIAAHVANTSDPVVDSCSSNWKMPVIACSALSSLSMHSVTSLACVPAGHPRWVLLNVSLGSATLSSRRRPFPTASLRASVRNLTGPKEEM
jgi:hypothetical protein